MPSSIEQAMAIVGLVSMLHASPIPMHKRVCGFCQCCWLAYPWFAYAGWLVGKAEGVCAGVVSAWVGIGCTALVALLVAVFTPLFRGAGPPEGPPAGRAVASDGSS